MVSPIYIVAIGLGVAFLIVLSNTKLFNFSLILLLLSLIAMTSISGFWLTHYLLLFPLSIDFPYEEFTAGFAPPIAINLRMSVFEAFMTFAINLFSIFAAIFNWKLFKENGKYALSIFLIFTMAANVIIMTRDVFNMFVFLEIASIATAGLVIFTQNTISISAGFKYLMSTSIISSLLLLGAIFGYVSFGSLNIDFYIIPILPDIAPVALFLILIALVLESKPVFANGWALDMYESAHPNIGAMFSSITTPTILFAIFKILPLIPESWLTVLGWIGIITFTVSNFLAIRQTHIRRLLGYSSIAQTGLMLMVLSFASELNDYFFPIFLGFLITNMVAKAGLFWLRDMIGPDELNKWNILRTKPLYYFLYIIFIFALAGFPPFPIFFAKWHLLMNLNFTSHAPEIILLLVGSLFELIYLSNWFVLTRDKESAQESTYRPAWNQIIPLFFSGLVLLFASAFYLNNLDLWLFAFPSAVVLLFFFIDFVPSWVKTVLAMVFVAIAAYYIYPLVQHDQIRLLFASLFVIGSLLTLIPTFARKEKRLFFHAYFVMVITGLLMLVVAGKNLEFFLGWEYMTLGSFFLVERRSLTKNTPLTFMIFSGVSAYFLLAGFMLLNQGGVSWFASIVKSIPEILIPGLILLLLGFFIKIAALGLHIWLPSAYAEADDDATPLISGVVINAGVLGLIWALFSWKLLNLPSDLFYYLGWLGALTALAGNMMAIYEENMKRLIAYSSMAAMGYVLFALSFDMHLGVLIALYYTIIHFLYKTMLFISAAGVAFRTKTHNMYEMGGLIKNMPLSFIAVLIGIIVLAGMPPLAGFPAKWMFYNAVVMKEWFFQGLIVFYSGIVAFLYLYKLIASVFLGQLKDPLRKVKEAPIWFIIPQFILIVFLLFISVFPDQILQPLASFVPSMFGGEQLSWNGTLANTSFGYNDAFAIMNIVMIMFAVLFTWLYINSRKAQKVKQFNIVFAAEKPFRPETTHVSYNMFAGYNKALGFLVYPIFSLGWKKVAEVIEDVAETIRKWYNGNGQAYALHVLLFSFIVYLIIFGGFAL